MPNFAIRPRRYRDRLDAIKDVLHHAQAGGKVIDVGLNPNSKYSLLVWAYDEIIRLREKCGETPPDGPRSKFLRGPRVMGESRPVKIEGEE